jgi:class 3 adenylate cyclase
MTSYGSEQIAVECFRLGVQDYVAKPFTPEQMLDAIENALCVTRLQQDKEKLTRQLVQTNRQLEQHIHEMNTLYHIGKSITALMPPETMLERIVDSVFFMTQSDECVLVLMDPETSQLREHLRRRHPRAAQRTTGGLSSILLNGNDQPLPPGKKVLAKPLEVGKRVIGHLGISKVTNEPFSAADERILGILADYAAIAIHNMQLIRQLHLTKEREKQQIRRLFERYVAPRVVEQVLTQPENVSLGGTHQEVAVLFADIRGFSAFSVTTPPAILVKLLNEYLRVAAEAVLAEEGTLDKFMGDAVMAFFNAPLLQPDYILRAVRAAWNLCRKVDQLHSRLPAGYRLKFGVGVGVGEVIVGNIGTPHLMNFTIIGDAVNKTKRLQENAQGGQILMAEETYHALKRQVQARYVSQIQLKGQIQAEPVYEVLGLQDGLETRFLKDPAVLNMV